MSAIASTRLVPRRDTTYRHGPLRHFATDVWVLMKRSIARIAREPETLADVSRRLFGNPDPTAAVHAWPMQHSELAVCCWPAAMLAVFAPLAVHLYRRQAQG